MRTRNKPKTLKCKNFKDCKTTVENVGHDAKSVTCHLCVRKSMADFYLDPKGFIEEYVQNRINASK